MHYDVFNGDADGICALHQLRLSHPMDGARWITGVKRDINLLARAELDTAVNCSFTVLDISLDTNKDALEKLLDRGNQVTYFDHHSARSIPDSPRLQPHIVFSADICTSLIVNNMLQDQHPRWAVCGAFGDNLHQPARELAARLSLEAEQIEQLREIGELLNYNGYGAALSDLHFHPADLYQAVQEFDDPLIFFRESPQLAVLREGYGNDMDLAMAQQPHPSSGRNRIYFLPNAPWARRVAGVFSNLKAREKRDAAHALLTENDDATLRVSVRAPIADPRDADTLCRQFPTGGGRAGAAGINQLPPTMLDQFIDVFNTIYS